VAATSYRCPSCSAPLPVQEPGAAVTCGHCGTQSRLPGGSEPDPGDLVLAERKSKAGGGWLGCIVLVALISIVPLIIGVSILISEVWKARQRQQVLDRVGRIQADVEAEAEALRAEVEQAAEPEEPQGLVRADLAALTSSRWQTFAEVPPGGLEAVDPVEVIPWATQVARAWSPDARLWRVDADHVPAAGRLDLVHDDKASVDLRFYSPTRVEAAEALRKVSEEPVITGLRMSIEEGEVSLMVGGLRPRDLDEQQPLPDLSDCGLDALMAAAATREGAQERPFYDLRLEVRTPYTGLDDWLWERSSGGGYVFPDTCEPWSLRTARARRR